MKIRIAPKGIHSAGESGKSSLLFSMPSTAICESIKDQSCRGIRRQSTCQGQFLGARREMPRDRRLPAFSSLIIDCDSVFKMNAPSSKAIASRQSPVAAALSILTSMILSSTFSSPCSALRVEKFTQITHQKTNCLLEIRLLLTEDNQQLSQCGASQKPCAA